jgi:RNA polymerase sigma-70 factor (ECF subfamily)
MEDGVGSASVGDQGIDVLWQTLHRDIRRRGVDAHVADDVTQETWLRIAARPPSRDRSLRPWLRVVGARVLAELLRRDRNRSARERRVARAVALEGEVARDDSRVMKLVAGLRSPYREVISLRYVDDLEVEEIAGRLGRSPVTVRSQLRRGLDLLRARLEGERDEQRSVRSLLAWLGIRRGGKLAPVWSCLGVAAVLALTVFLFSGLDQRRASAGAPVVGSAPDSAGRAGTAMLGPDKGARTLATGLPGIAEPELDSIPPRAVLGVVRFPDGTPAAGARVWKGTGKGAVGEVVAVTDAAGRYAAGSVEIKRFLWATLPGWMPTRRTHVGASVQGKAMELVLGSSPGRLELSLREGGGLPVAGAEIELDWSLDHYTIALHSSSGELQYEAEVQTGQTDDLGRLELARPDAERVQLRVRVRGRADHVEPIALAEGDSKKEIVLPRPAHLAGTVVDALGEPSPGASIELVTQGGLATTDLETDETGAFEIALDPGPYELRVSEAKARGRRGCSEEGFLERDERRLAKLVLGEEHLRGRALADGKPLAKALVVCTRAGGEDRAPVSAREYTDLEGRFSFPGHEPGERVDLRLFSPSWDLLCERESVGVGEEVVLSSSLDPSPRRLELRFECEDPSLVPTMVELRSKDLLDKGFPFPVDPATRTCVLSAPRSSAFQIAPWVPVLGSWVIESARLGPGELQLLRVPRPTRIQFQLDLPPSVSPDAIRGGIRAGGLRCATVANPAGFLSIRELRLDPSTLCAEARLLPGTHRWFFLGAGLAHAAGDLRVVEGETATEIVRMDPGIEAAVTVVFPRRAVTPLLIVRTSTGRAKVDGARVQIDGDRATFFVGLPARELVLEARAQDLSGTRRLLPGELAPGATRPEFTIELEPLESPAGKSEGPVATGRESD